MQPPACADPLVLTTVDVAAVDSVSPPSALDALQPGGHAPRLVSSGHLFPSLPLPTLHKATAVVAGLLVVAGLFVTVGVGAVTGLLVTGVVPDWEPAPLMVMPEAA